MKVRAQSTNPDQVIAEMKMELRKLLRTGRNERCPCGSKKKFKRCCQPGLSK